MGTTSLTTTSILARALLLSFYALPIWSFQFHGASTAVSASYNNYLVQSKYENGWSCCRGRDQKRTPRLGLFFPLYSAPTTVIDNASTIGYRDRFNNNSTSFSFDNFSSLDCMEGGEIETRPGKAAVILNTNARAVTAKVERLAKQVFGDATVFVTTCAEEAEAAARCIVASNNNNNNNKENYQMVVPVGGDGTLTATIDYMVQAILKQNKHLTLPQAIQKLPVIGYVPLGTGNGVGSVVGCTLNRKIRRKNMLKNVFEALQQVAATSTLDHLGFAPKMETSIVELPMMQVITTTATTETPATNTTGSSTIRAGDLCFFAGVGFDSLMLNDYKNIKAWSKKTGFLPSFLSSVAGYCVALVVKTLPKALLHRKHNIHVTVTTPNDPAETLWVDHRRGDFVQKCHSPILFQGETGILAAGTAPFYGGGLRLFPFARLTVDKMHLRLGRISPMTGFFNIPRIFAGSYRDTTDRMGVLDFIGSEFDVFVEGTDGRGFPLQHSGESVGDVEHFRLRVVEEPVRFISFLPKRR